MKAIKTKYHGPTNTKGARISADDGDGHKITISYPCELNIDAAHQKAASELCSKIGWSGELTPGWYRDECFWVFEYLPRG